ncbi:MAG: enoyl-CoA hydratase/isomerase family protein [Gammaproteobacteria bacterium]|nr:enoyl-CoA hydratase/isomerase family protein [Gammaproteobacteria bacterium]
MYDFETLTTRKEGRVLFATINNPPVNVMTPSLYMDLVNFTTEVEVDESVKVVVMESADPDFFIAHFDVAVLLEIPVDTPPERSEALNPFHQMCERMRTMPKATIAKIAGRVGGGGSEFSASCDMRFGLLGKTQVNQMEVALGILPGGTGTQRLPRLVGRGRAMEIILGSDDIDAETAEKWGYLNRAFSTTEELDSFVDQLAHRIAAWPADAIAMAKQSVNNAELPLAEGLVEEAYLFQKTLRTRGAQQSMQRAMELGAQTREGELRMGDLCLQVAESLNDKD